MVKFRVCLPAGHPAIKQIAPSHADDETWLESEFRICDIEAEVVPMVGDRIALLGAWWTVTGRWFDYELETIRLVVT